MSKIELSKVDKYSKNDGGSFKFTLLAYSQRGRKNIPKTRILERFLQETVSENQQKVVPKSI